MGRWQAVADCSEVPGNQAKLDATTESARFADEADLPLAQLALTLVTPATSTMSAAISGSAAPGATGELHDQLSVTTPRPGTRRAGPPR
ncbi:hypothetical protein [Streptomyces albus]|uniref:hypothetical protein n=1 Tax=Streptomyces albus TaxID=1888 RepID=UPI003451D3B5